MGVSKAQTVDEYLDELPEDRRPQIEAVRKVILENLPEGFEETIGYNMIAYVVPLKTCPKTYNGEPLMLASLGNQKNHMAVYMMSIYGNPDIEDWFMDEYKKTGKKLDMGKSCVRFKSLDDLPLELIGEAISKMSCDDFVAYYEKSMADRKKSK